MGKKTPVEIQIHGISKDGTMITIVNLFTQGDNNDQFKYARFGTGLKMKDGQTKIIEDSFYAEWPEGGKEFMMYEIPNQDGNNSGKKIVLINFAIAELSAKQLIDIGTDPSNLSIKPSSSQIYQNKFSKGITTLKPNPTKINDSESSSTNLKAGTSNPMVPQIHPKKQDGTQSSSSPVRMKSIDIDSCDIDVEGLIKKGVSMSKINDMIGENCNPKMREPFPTVRHLTNKVINISTLATSHLTNHIITATNLPYPSTLISPDIKNVVSLFLPIP